MKFRKGVYEKYGLNSCKFDESMFWEDWGEKLYSNRLGRVADDIISEASERLFLTAPLSDNDMKTISDKETIRSARDAEDFRSKVAAVKINESMEPLVDLRNTNEALNNIWTFTKLGYHEACGEWAGKDKLFLVRSSVACRLSDLASKLILLDSKIHFQDGFRPLGVQEGLFSRRIRMAKEAHPDWNGEQILLEARSKTAFTPRFAAHKAGAAVDVSLYNYVSGDFHDIGQGYPNGGELVRQNTEFLTQKQWQNRKILEHVARSCGLLMYPYESWHLCYGDTTAAVVLGGKLPYVAQYGPIKSYDSKTGKITSVYTPEELDAIFSLDGVM